MNSQALPLAPPAAAQSSRISDAHRRRLAARVRLLSWVSLSYMALEGGIAILAGVLAGSIALIGFGLDSAIEGFASAIIVWRFTGTRMQRLAAPPDDWGGRAVIDWAALLARDARFEPAADRLVDLARVLDAIYCSRGAAGRRGTI